MKHRSTSVLNALFSLLCLSLIATSLLAVQTPIKDIATLRQLAPDSAAKALTVDLQAQVTRVHRPYSGLFVHDGTKGVYVSCNRLDLPADHFKVGDLVRIQGYSRAGDFVPTIVATASEIIGHEALPQAPAFRPDQMYSTSIDCERVSLSGRLISMREEAVAYRHNELLTYQRIVLEVQKDNLTYLIQMPFTQETEQQLRSKLFQQVSFNAVVGTLSNDQRQMGGRVFFVNSPEDFLSVDEPLITNHIETLPIHHLMRVDFDITKLVKTYGVVTSVSDGHLTLRGKEASLLVSVPSPPQFALGDSVIVEGIVWPSPISPAFRARQIELEEKSVSEPQALPLPYDDVIPTHFHHELVQLDARVIDWRKPLRNDSDEISEVQLQLLCRAGDIFFEADILADDITSAKLKPGALVRLTGICELKQYENDQWSIQINGFTLHIRSADDIVILQSAPKWTTRRLLSVVAIVTVACLSCLLWIVLLRKTVSKQTKEISRQIQHATEMEERQRIARELHDNLNQGLVGAKLQITNSKRLLDKKVLSQIKALQSDTEHKTSTRLEQMAAGVERCQQTLDVAQSIILHCGNESRNAILDLRKGDLEGMDLESSIRQFIDTLTNEGNIDISFSADGILPTLELETKRNLFLICREAVTNALRHAQATAITLRLSSSEDDLSLCIQDNGIGFNMEADASENHFGLQSMYERADKLMGNLVIESAPGNGTSIKVTLPYSAPSNAS